jgi:hypothetical protein
MFPIRVRNTLSQLKNRTLSNWTSTWMASSGLRVPLETISSSVSVRHMPMVDRLYSSKVAIAFACAK